MKPEKFSCLIMDNKGWGAQIIDNFPNPTGFSMRNLKYMKAFAKEYPNSPIAQMPFAQNKDEINLMQVLLIRQTKFLVN